ncbi:hypothetical protein BaRGS_00009684, partial [Batillaria attramentaria]
AGTLDLENSTVVKQRQEIQLLVQELKERDCELNEIVKSHQLQLSLWEKDRQLILRLQEKCAFLAEQVQHGEKELVSVTTKQQGAQKKTESKGLAFQSAHAQLHKSISDSLEKAVHLQEFENCKKTLSDSLREVSTAKGHLEAREQELITLIKLKDFKLDEAASDMKILKAKLKEMELESQNLDRSMPYASAAIQWQHQYQTAKKQNDQLKLLCQEKDSMVEQLSSQLSESQRHAVMLQRALDASGERERCQNAIICSLRSQQERTKKELIHLTNLYKRQNREVALLQLSLDSSRESCKEVGEHSVDPTPLSLAKTVKSTCSTNHGTASSKKSGSLSQVKSKGNTPKLHQVLLEDLDSYTNEHENLHNFSQDYSCAKEELEVFRIAHHQPRIDRAELMNVPVLPEQEKSAEPPCHRTFQLSDFQPSSHMDKNRNAGASLSEHDSPSLDTSYEENELQEPTAYCFEWHTLGEIKGRLNNSADRRLSSGYSSLGRDQEQFGMEALQKRMNSTKYNSQGNEDKDASNTQLEDTLLCSGCNELDIDTPKMHDMKNGSQSQRQNVEMENCDKWSPQQNGPTCITLSREDTDKTYSVLEQRDTGDRSDCRQVPTLETCRSTSYFDEKLISYLSSPECELDNDHPNNV